MNKSQIHQTGGPSSGLGELLTLGLKPPESWTPEELEAALAEQITAPIEFELSALKPAEAKALRACAEAHGLVLKNLNALFQHPHPPLELLVMAKEFFKANSTRPHPGLPAEVARALYYLTVAVAWLRHHRRISTLSDVQVVSALDWLSERHWVKGDLHKLAAETMEQLRQAHVEIRDER